MDKLRQAHAKEKKEALAEFRAFKRTAKDREESIQVRILNTLLLVGSARRCVICALWCLIVLAGRIPFLGKIWDKSVGIRVGYINAVVQGLTHVLWKEPLLLGYFISADCSE